MKKLFILILVVGIVCYWVYGRREKIKNFPNTNQAVVAFGDSLTEGYGAARGESYPDVLAKKINRPVVNLGRSGELAVQAPARLDDVLDEEPYMVLIEFGANDFMQHKSTQAAVEAVAKIVDEVQAAGAIAVIVNTGGPGMGDYTKAYKKMAREKGALYVPVILKGIFYRQKYKSDQVHPNAQGYEKVAEKVYKVIKDYL